ncbi:unnamed protein product, partial [Adineta steineri]
MLSNLLVEMSPSPPVPRKRQIETNQQKLSSLITSSIDQESTFMSSNITNKRHRPLQSQSLTRYDDYRRLRQYPKTLEIFIPMDTNDNNTEKQSTIKRSFEYEVEKKKRSSSENLRQQRPQHDFEVELEYLRCLDDLTNEYEKLKRQKKPVDNRKKKTTTYETTEQFESIEKIYHNQPQPQQQPIHQYSQHDNIYQRSASENILHKHSKPILTTTDLPLSDDEFSRLEYNLLRKERLKPIHIHSSTNSIPGETSIKYVSTERLPVEVLVPKPQIRTTHGEHSSTTMKDVRQSTRKKTTNIHQQRRRKTIEGQHELRIIEQPIISGRTLPVEFTIPKPIETLPVEHTSTFIVKSKKGGRFQTLDISKSLTRERRLSGEHELRVISEPIRSNLHNKPVELLFPKPTLTSKSSHHSSTIVKQNRTPKSSLILDNIQTLLKGEHELRLVDKPIESGPSNSVELIVPKSVTETVEHTSTIITETQPQRRVLEITGSGRKIENEYETKYFHDTVRVEEEIEVKLPKQKYEQVDHSSTIIKHSRGKGPIIDIDTTYKTIQGEHELKIFEESIETKADTMQLLVPKPKISSEHHSTTVIKGQRGKPQILTIDRKPIIPGDHETKYHEQPVESYSEMEVLFPKSQSRYNQQVAYDDRLMETRSSELQRKYHQTSNDYNERYMLTTNEYEEEEDIGGEHSTTYFKQARAKYEPIELVVDRPKILPSISKLIADIHAPTQITSIKPTKYTLTEDSSTKIDMDVTKDRFHEQYDEMELVFERPLVRDSSTTLLANIQSGLELKSIQPTTQQTIKTDIQKSSSTLTMQRGEQQSDEELLELRLRKPYIQDSSSIVLANIQPELGIQGQLKHTPYIPQPIEESSSALLMELNTEQYRTPFELIIPRLDVESSSSTVLAQVSPALAGLRAKIDVPQLEKSTSTVLFEQTTRSDKEIELIMPKPKQIETSTTTMIADVQAKLETKNIRPSEIQPERSTSTVYFDETVQHVRPQPVELRMKQPIIGDSSTTLLANVKPTIDTQQIQIFGNQNQTLENSSSAILFDTKNEQIQPSEIELRIPRPHIQESTSVMLANIRPTLDTSHTHLVIPSSLQSPIKSSSELIIEQDNIDETTVESYLHRQTNSNTVLTELEDTRIENDEMYILGTNNQLQQQQYGSSMIHADLNKPLELIFNVDEGNTSAISSQYKRGHNSRILANTSAGTTSNPYQPVEFLLSGGGGLSGYNTTVEEYTTGGSGTGGYTTTKTTTKRTITSADAGGYNEGTNKSLVRGIRPFDQVDLILQPDSSISSSKLLSTNLSSEQGGYSPHFNVSLHDQTVREGESVLFEIIVSAQPSAEIIWDKDDQLIGDDSAFRLDYYGDGRATLYIPEAFADDQGYYTCTVTNSHGTCRTTARLNVDSSGEGPSPKRRQLESSSNVYYRQGPTQTIESYSVYSKPSTTITQVTEETQVYRIPAHQQQQQQQQHQHNEISYSVQGTQPKFQPIQFLVSANQDNNQAITTTTITTDENDQSLFTSPYQNYNSQLQTLSNRNNLSSYGDQTNTITTTTYSQQQQPRHTGLIATVAKQAGPTPSHYQLATTQEYDNMQTESEISPIHFNRSIQQDSSTSYITTRPNFTKPLEPVNAVEGGTVQITVHLTAVGPQHSRPEIQWYHHGQPIVSDNQHYRITEGYDTAILEIINVKKHDTGPVWCVANTPAGSATTTCAITVEEKPVRTQRHIKTTQQHIVPQESVYDTHSIHSTHAQIPLHYHQQQQQIDQRVPTQYYSSQTISQQQISPQSFTSQTPLSYQQQQQISPQSTTSQTYSSVSYQTPQHQAPFQSYTPQQASLQSHQIPYQTATPQLQQPQTASQPFIPQAPPLLPNFNTRQNYSDQQIKILN